MRASERHASLPLGMTINPPRCFDATSTTWTSGALYSPRHIASDVIRVKLKTHPLISPLGRIELDAYRSEADALNRRANTALFGVYAYTSSFLSVCVRRRVPSDENLNTDYAPIQRYPRYGQPNPAPEELCAYDADLDCSYFRRRPRSVCNQPDPKRYTWMPEDEDFTRME
ncbi:hypothetical protein EVAR_83115_1 [Eumeta japonica]|uniref:Uncharacterized protein n=1 Tax=Eumeta variegata TaxID=151549 RepID=A0A4C1WQ75_EUMVA|nr:hypothetical protein EVAR_83115_1 [Eumeta japonica]